MNRFIKNKLNPVFGGPDIGTMFDVLIQQYSGEPSDLPGARYRMDVSWRPQKALAVSFSENGIKWTPPQITLSCDVSTGWEDDINRNCVLKNGERYLMWYTGQYDNHSYSSIGFAESSDGLNFTRSSVVCGKPVLVRENDWEGDSVMNPCVLYENGIYRMYYSAGETFEPNVIALAYSKDGIHWEKDNINPIFSCNPDNEYEQNRVGGCQVIHTDKLGYIMFYIGYRDVSTACICCALSSDGRTGWRRYKYNPLVTPTKNSWDADSCYKPSALFDEEKNGWHIWYNGRKGNDEYIGEAFMEGDFSDSDFE